MHGSQRLPCLTCSSIILASVPVAVQVEELESTIADLHQNISGLHSAAEESSQLELGARQEAQELRNQLQQVWLHFLDALIRWLSHGVQASTDF